MIDFIGGKATTAIGGKQSITCFQVPKLWDKRFIFVQSLQRVVGSRVCLIVQ